MSTSHSSTRIGLEQVHGIAPYVGGKPISEVARQFGLDETKIVKLASNENPLGMPSSAKLAMAKAIEDLGRYPDSNGFELKAVISKKFNVPENWITLGNGSNDILELSARAVAQKGDEIIYSQHAFAVYPLATQAVGAKGVEVPAIPNTLGHDLPAMLAAVNAKTKLIYLANPNNPTGTFIPGSEIAQFLAKVPSHVVVVVDEAYTEFLSEEQRYDSLAFARQYPNVIISRTLSKAYGLAGLRIGFGIAQPELTDLLNRIRQPFNVNSLAQAAAIAALQDEEFLQKSAQLNKEGYTQLIAGFDKLGLNYIPSSGNFVLVQVGDDNDAGARVNLSLLKQGVIVRPVGNYGLPKWLRVSIGLPEENAAFLKALGKAIAE